MDHASYHVVYVDTRLSRGLDGELIQRAKKAPMDVLEGRTDAQLEEYNPDCLKAIIGEIEEVRANLKSLLSQFNGGKLSHLIYYVLDMDFVP